MANSKRPKVKSKAAEKRERAEKRRKHTLFLTEHDMLSYARSHPASDCGKGKCSSYHDGASAKPSGMSGDGEAAVHHILPVSAVVGFMKVYKNDQTALDNIASVYGQVKWCINTDKNLTWLPYFPAYQRFLNNGGPRPDGLAAHNWDHHTYSETVINILKPVWEGMKNQTPPQKCNKGKELVETLTNLIGWIEPTLTSRATKVVLDQALEIKIKGRRAAAVQVAALESSLWWGHFSMTPLDAIERPIALLLAGRLSPALRAAITRST